MRKALLLVGFFTGSIVFGQDIHFSTYTQFEQEENPAFIGTMSGLYRAKIFYRNQWSVVPVPYITTGITVDGRFFPSKQQNAWVGGGLTVYKDAAGDLKLSENYVGLAGAVMLGISNTTFIGAGLSFSYSWYSIDLANAKGISQWDGFQYDPNVPLGEGPIGTYSTPNLSVGIGGMYNIEVFRLAGGIALHNLIGARNAFYGNETKAKRIVAHLRSYVELNKQWALVPFAFFSYQSPFWELTIGSLVRYDINPDAAFVHGVSAGVAYRTRDAIAPIIRYEFRSIDITVAYDLITSTLKQDIGSMAGGPEVTLSVMYPFEGSRKGYGKIYCPRF